MCCNLPLDRRGTNIARSVTPETIVETFAKTFANSSECKEEKSLTLRSVHRENGFLSFYNIAMGIALLGKKRTSK